MLRSHRQLKSLAPLAVMISQSLPNSSASPGKHTNCLNVNDCIDELLTRTSKEHPEPTTSSGGCLDDFYCDDAATSLLGHFLLGPLALILCLTAIFTQLIFFSIFRAKKYRISTASRFFSAMCFFDALTTLLLCLIPITLHLPRMFSIQMEMYHCFTVYLVPFGLPLLQCADLISLYLVLVLILVRFRCSLHKIRHVTPFLTALVLLSIAYSLPKFFKYSIQTNKDNQTVLAMSNSTMQKLFSHFIQISVEYFLPFACIAGFLLCLLAQRIKRCFIPADSPGFVDQTAGRTIEQVNDDLTVYASLLVFACRLPSFCFHALRTSLPSDRILFSKFDTIAYFLLILSLTAKPILYFFLGDPYRQSLRQMISCPCTPSKEAQDSTFSSASSLTVSNRDIQQIPLKDIQNHAHKYVQHQYQPIKQVASELDCASQVQSVQVTDCAAPAQTEVNEDEELSYFDASSAPGSTTHRSQPRRERADCGMSENAAYYSAEDITDVGLFFTTPVENNSS